MSIDRKLIGLHTTKILASWVFGVNGYIKFTNGIKIIWGTSDQIRLYDYSNKDFDITFPYPFTGSMGTLLATLVNNTANANCTVHARYLFKNKFTAYIDKTSSTQNPTGYGQIAYIAIGSDTI